MLQPARDQLPKQAKNSGESQRELCCRWLSTAKQDIETPYFGGCLSINHVHCGRLPALCINLTLFRDEPGADGPFAKTCTQPFDPCCTTCAKSQLLCQCKTGQCEQTSDQITWLLHAESCRGLHHSLAYDGNKTIQQLLNRVRIQNTTHKEKQCEPTNALGAITQPGSRVWCCAHWPDT